MSVPKTKETPTYAFGTGVWVKKLHRIWWPGIVVDPLTTPQELDLVNNVEHIAIVKFEQENKYEVVGINDQIFLYMCDRKIDFIEKGLSSLKKQKKRVSKTDEDMNNFKKVIISMESLFGGDVCIFENLEEKQKIVKSVIKQFSQTLTKKSKKKKIKKKSLLVPKPVSKPRKSTQSKVDKTYNEPTSSTIYSCQSEVACNFTTSRHVRLERHIALIHNNKRKNLKTKSGVKKQKRQEKLLNDCDHRDENDELNTSKDNKVQLSSNVTQSSINEEVVETTSAVNTLDQVNNFENSSSCISSSINNSDANILTEDNNVIGVSQLSECRSQLIEVENIETEDRTIVEENTNGKEKVSNDVEVNQLNVTTIDKAMPIENSCSVDDTSNKMDCEDEITKKKYCLIDGIPNTEWTEEDDWESTPSTPREEISTLNNILKTNQKQVLLKDSEDKESLRGKFSWKLIKGYNVPYIIRVINGEHLKFVSVRMASNQLHNKNLHADIYKCTLVKSHFITENEALLLNEINREHSDCKYGEEMFFAGKDYIIHLDDVCEYYTFIEICYEQLLGKNTPDRKNKCGFILINSESYVPYCVKDSRTYVPLFCFEGTAEIENLRHDIIDIDNWNLAYLKFCCKVQGIRNNLFASNSCTVSSLDNIKNYFPRETIFEDYWPSNRHNSHLLVKQNNSSTHAWTRTLTEIEPGENTISHTLTTPANQMGSTMSQCSSLIKNTGHIVPSPPLVCASNTAPVIGNTVSYSNIEPPTLQQIQQLNTLRNVEPIVIVPATEIIDLTSTLSTPVPPTVQENSLPYERELTRIPRRKCARDI
ncbi:uncharacterized protein LOC132946896 isoform X2 [Metopolophium dirhodum]|uniref:uncharacterized protein LOC132946896 isoform X2 n=1 Tax=Metopolophium dirhodum TaxID=44670 RepID=UPI00298F8D5B|nr:uncharacterized protein LOC132946896 isoform X2 [Metopolophium dirhodum]